jgi:NAD(P)-dependent dehydrogenase (short-subunit alcohol dehydrogenase family)
MAAPSLKGKFAIVTGAGNGIGCAIAEAFAAAGGGVCCADLDRSAATATANRILGNGGVAFAEGLDVSDGRQAGVVVAAAVGRFGALHVLVNNAAFFPPKASVAELSVADWDRVLAVNIGGAFHMSRHAIPRLKAAGGGSIIHIASQMAQVGSAGDAAYCATKAALLGFARAMALDHAKDGIRVNTLSPGGVATRQLAIEFGGLEKAEQDWGQAMHPIGRLARPEEIARAALFLASDDSSFMTGADLLVDGGYTAQ